MSVFSNVITPQGLEPLQFPTKFRSHSRTDTGGFKKVEELMNVRGIGEATFLRIRELVRVSPSEGKR